MEFTLYSDVSAFYDDVFEILMRDEALNQIPAGNLLIGADRYGWQDPANWFLATVSDETGIRLTAIMTRPYHLTLYATDNQYDDSTLACLVDGLLGTTFSVGTMMAENTLAQDFAQTYSAATGREHHIKVRQRLYALDHVNPEIPSIGHLRLAQESDMAFLPYWSQAFDSECLGMMPSLSDNVEISQKNIATKKMYVLEDNGTPVSMARITREMRTVCAVVAVYTPPYFRGKGYASSCVAGVSRVILERGFERAVLYTDLSNPTSNSIYQKIGYQPIGDSMIIAFE